MRPARSNELGDARRRSPVLLDSASCGHRPQAAETDKKSGKRLSELKNLSTHCGHQDPDKASGKRREIRQNAAKSRLPAS